MDGWVGAKIWSSSPPSISSLELIHFDRACSCFGKRGVGRFDFTGADYQFQRKFFRTIVPHLAGQEVFITEVLSDNGGEVESRKVGTG
jgi:hypothetical protein